METHVHFTDYIICKGAAVIVYDMTQNMEYIIIIITDEKHGDCDYRETLTVRGEKLCTHDPGKQEGLPNMVLDTFETFEFSVPQLTTALGGGGQS